MASQGVKNSIGRSIDYRWGLGSILPESCTDQYSIQIYAVYFPFTYREDKNQFYGRFSC